MLFLSIFKIGDALFVATLALSFDVLVVGLGYGEFGLEALKEVDDLRDGVLISSKLDEGRNGWSVEAVLLLVHGLDHRCGECLELSLDKFKRSCDASN